MVEDDDGTTNNIKRRVGVIDTSSSIQDVKAALDGIQVPGTPSIGGKHLMYLRCLD